MLSKIIILATLLVLFSCRSRNTLSLTQKKALVDSAANTLSWYHKDVRAQGLLAELKYLDSSAEFFWVPPGYSSALSFDSVAHILRMNAPLWKSVDNFWRTLRVDQLSDNMVAYTGVMESSMTDTAGVELKFKMIETGVMVKRTDGWKLLKGQTAIIE